jgi:hypothetical protein
MMVVILAMLGLWASCASARGVTAAEELLKHLDEWPGASVRVPASLLRAYAKSLADEIAAPKDPAPVDFILSRSEYHANIAGEQLRLGVAMDIAVLNPVASLSLRVLPAHLVWEKTRVAGKSVALRKQNGWLWLDLENVVPNANGPRILKFVAETQMEASSAARGYRVRLPLKGGVVNALSVDSSDALEFSSSSATEPLMGDRAKGTHGRMAMRLDGIKEAATVLSWRVREPERVREGRPSYMSYVSWHIEEGIQTIRAHMAVRISGGSRDRLVVLLPSGVDRARITGSDVRAVRISGQRAIIDLKGRIRGATTLQVESMRPLRKGTVRLSLAGPRIEGGSLRGGYVTVTSALMAAILDDSLQALQEASMWGLPKEMTALTTGTPILSYAASGGDWRLSVQIASFAKLRMKDSVVDRSDVEILVRPGGVMLQKVLLRVRNRKRQFLRVRLPQKDDRIIFVRVAEKNVIPTWDGVGNLNIPLVKSTETIGGAVSFPVEIVFMGRMPNLKKNGRFRVPLLRCDLSVARTICTVRMPRGFEVDEWKGDFALTEDLSAVVGAMEYGRSHEHDAETIRRKALAMSYYRNAQKEYARGRYQEAALAIKHSLGQNILYDSKADAERLKQNLDALLRPANAPYISGGGKARAAKQRILRVETARQQDIQSSQEVLIQKGWKLAKEGNEQAAADAFNAAKEVGRRQTKTKAGEARQAQSEGKISGWLKNYNKEAELNRSLKAQFKTKKMLQQQAIVSDSFQKVVVVRKREEEKLRLRDRLTWPGGHYEYSARPVWDRIERRIGVELPTARTVPGPSGMHPDRMSLRQYNIRMIVKRLGNAAILLQLVRDHTGQNVVWDDVLVLPNTGDDDDDDGVNVKGQRAMVYRNGWLMVLHTDAVHKSIEAFLNDFGRASANGSSKSAPVTGSNIDAGYNIAGQRTKGLIGRAKGEQQSLSLQNALIEKKLADETENDEEVNLRSVSQILADVKKDVDKRITSNEFVSADEVLLSARKELKKTVSKDTYKTLEQGYLKKLELDVAKKRGSAEVSVVDKVDAQEGEQLKDFIYVNYRQSHVDYVDGNLVVKGSDKKAEKELRTIYVNFRSNAEQQVAYNYRGLGLTESAVADMGVTWNGKRGGLWAQIDDGQLNALLMVERQQGRSGLVKSKGRRQIIPGTRVTLPNGVGFGVAMAKDDSNTFWVNNESVSLAHNRIILLSRNGEILVLRAGATQHWLETPNAPEIHELPYEITVPAIGVPVRFEKVLVKPNEELVIECNYSYEEVADE